MGSALAGRRRLIWLLVAVVVLASIAFGVVRALTAGAAGTETKAAATATADKGAVTTEVATTGTLQAAQTRSLSFTVDGTVEAVKVRAGSAVTEGQVLASVDDTDAAEAVDDAQDALAEAQDALAEAEDSAASPASSAAATSGCDVAAAYTTAPSPAASATASAVPSATATTPAPSASVTAPASASATSGRTPKASASAAARPSQGSGATTGGSCATSGAGSTGGGQQQGGGSSGSSSGDAILSAEQRVNKAEVALAEAEEAYAGATITAPIAGKILTVSGKVGSQVGSGSAFITLADVYDMQISADFPEADADHLEVRQSAVITLADRVGETFDATVVQVDPVGTSDGTLTRFGVVLSFDDAPEALLVGQSASVRVTTGTRKDVLRVPSTAVHDVSGSGGTVLKNGVTTQVELGLRGDQYTEITSGLAEGDVVAKSW